MPATILDRPGPSEAERLAELSSPAREEWLATWTDEQLRALEQDWSFWQRPAQAIPPGSWWAWLIMSGRGFGKTRTGAETIHHWSNQVPLMAIIGEDAGEVRDVMVEGETGILETAHPDNRPHYEPSKRRLTWPNGCRATTFGAGEDPEQLRGPQFYKAWCDELAKWKRLNDAWEQIELSIRLGRLPQVVLTTTPRPNKVMKELIKDTDTVITKGTSYENIGNLSPVYIRRVIKRYEGTRLGRQELHAELLDDVPGALWTRAMINYRPHPDLVRVVVAVDPAASNTEESSETGIIGAGRGVDGDLYVLADRSAKMSPLGWGKRAILLYDELKADRIVYEVNQGGDMVTAVLQMAAKELDVPTPPLEPVHASRGKQTRAEPISAIYEQDRAHHVDEFLELEDQLTSWVPEDDSPDRLDAAVWAASALMLNRPEEMSDEEREAFQNLQIHN